MKHVFIADDGKQFDDKLECVAYEHEQEKKREEEKRKREEEIARNKKLREEKEKRLKEVEDAWSHFEKLRKQYIEDYCKGKDHTYDTLNDLFNYIFS